jgi:two-component system, cell cycle sensor histidine kinase and response regulator CckA
MDPVRMNLAGVSESMSKESADSLLDAVYEFDGRGRLVYANMAARTLFGFTTEQDVSGLRLDATIIPEDQEGSRRDVARIFAGESVSGERTFVRTDGARFVGEVHSGPVYDGDRVVGVRGVLRDITARRVAEERLRESELRFKALFELAPLPISVTELETGTLIDVNRKFCEVSGYERDELIGRATWETGVVCQEEREKFAAIMGESGEVVGLPVAVRNRQGSKIDALVCARSIEVSGQTLLLTAVTDITERNRLEAELLQARKMEAIGTLAGGLAHDFNNLLMVIGGLASLGGAELEEVHPLREPLRRIEEQVANGAALTRQLLTFARAGNFSVAPADLNQIVERSAGVFARTHKDIIVELDCAADVWPVEVDSALIEQMLLNLYVNAAHAMPQGGQLRVTTRNVSHASLATRAAAGHCVEIVVKDTGTGMDEETLRRIFDPFFTTKQMGHGTGLGLASVHGTVQKHAGSIKVASEPGAGTQFDILLPASSVPVPSGRVDPREVSAGIGRILLVDDQQVVAEVVEAMLRDIGYDVIVAHDGASAIELFRARAVEIDVVLLDMVMPKMSGPAVFEQLRQIRSDVAVVLMSGYALSGASEREVCKGCKGFLQKPFDVDELSNVITAATSPTG